ncbi:MAG TPA: hypothetical protein VEF34_18530 [Syntrophobacteraceae bacterium]|nr:hypothetical protein [Syntrophobacteraceae bacterium]
MSNTGGPSGSGGATWSRSINMTVGFAYTNQRGGVWIADSTNGNWHLLDSSSTDVHPALMFPQRAMTYSIDDDVMMFLGGTTDMRGTWLFDVYTNTWYQPVVSNPWGASATAEQGLTYDSQLHRYLRFGSAGQLRDLWTYNSATNSWAQENYNQPNGWYQTSIAQTVHSGDMSITVANAAGAQRGGSIVIRSNIGKVDEISSEGEYAYIPLAITAVAGDVISVSNASNYWAKYMVELNNAMLTSDEIRQFLDLNFICDELNLSTGAWTPNGTTIAMYGPKAHASELAALSYVVSVSAPVDPGILCNPGYYGGVVPPGVTVDIYPPGWPPYSLAGYMPEGGGGAGGPSIATVLGVNGVYDDIHHKHLFFIPRRDDNMIHAYAYNLNTHTWEKKSTSSNDMRTHRAGDNPTQWMHQNNAVIMTDLGGGIGGTTIRYYRYDVSAAPIETPTALTATVNAGGIGLSWNAVSTAAGYYIYRETGPVPYGHSWKTCWNGSAWSTSGAQYLVRGTTFTDTAVSRGTKYYYRVAAFDGKNTSPLSVMARGVPKLIWDGYVMVTGPSHETVNWVPRDTNVTGYNVYRATCAAFYYPTPVTTVGQDGHWTQASGNVYKRPITVDWPGLRNSQGDIISAWVFNSFHDNTANQDFTYVGSVASLTAPYQYTVEMDNVGGHWIQVVYAYLDARPPTHSLTYSLKEAGPEYAYTSNVIGYCIPGAYAKITSGGCASPVSGTSCSDTANLGAAPYTVYAYRVTSINQLGVESGPSPSFKTVPRAPHHVNWTWDSKTGDVSLKWNASPDASQYLVYKLNTPLATFSKLTPSPISATTYTDFGGVPSSSQNQQYYVVAVDKLDQEGEPSERSSINRSELSFWTAHGYLNGYNSGFGSTDIPSPPAGLRLVE